VWAGDPAIEPARADLGLPARLQPVDQRLCHTRADGQSARANGRAANLRRGAGLLQLAGFGQPLADPSAGDRGADVRRVVRDPASCPAREGLMSARPRRLRLPFVIAAYLALLAPLVVVIAVSFGPSAVFEFPPRGVTLYWFEAFFASPAFVTAFFRVSLVVG